MCDEPKQEIDRVTRILARAKVKRTSVIAQIKSIHDLGVRVAKEPEIGPTFSVIAADLESLWTQFKTEDDCVLDYLVVLDKLTEYSPDAIAELRRLISDSKAVANSLIPKGAEAIDLSYIREKLPPHTSAPDDTGNTFSRLPEIPLPTFDGDFQLWPTFRDRFKAVVDNRPKLSNIDKMYYLVGCLKGAAAEAVQGIPVSADNYALVWSTLSDRFNRPRLVATSLIENLLNTSTMSQESLRDLNKFIGTFNESNSLLDALKIPDLGSFILFSIAFRCLPMSTRQLFEAGGTADYPSLIQLLEFVRTRVAILEVVGELPNNAAIAVPIKSNKAPDSSRKGREYSGKSQGSRLTSMVTSKIDTTCPCCTEPHELASCMRFNAWDVEERVRWTKEQKRCFNCFSPKHWAPKCKNKPRCNDCSRRHHSLLHVSVGERYNNDDAQPAQVMCASAPQPLSSLPTTVMLGTALVHIRDRTGSWQTIRALTDCASQISAITVACAERLGLKRSRWTAPISGLSGMPVNVHGRAECTVQPRFATEPVLSVHAWVLPTITSDLPGRSLPADIKNRFSNLALADPSFYVSSPIDLLLGSDVYASIMDGRKCTVDSALPSAYSSIFGCILIGPVSELVVCPYQSALVSMTVSIEGLMERFWHAEEPAMAPATFSNDGRCEQMFQDKVVRLPSGRFSVSLPFCVPASDDTFRGSREVALRRFDALERKLAANPPLKVLYDKFMAEYISLGHMSLSTSPGTYIIPHHAIYRLEVDAQKIRVVFDASACSGRGPSLNECLLPGPKLQRDIVDILTRFRIHKYVFTTDICKMYRQILILPEYRRFQHILWRSLPHDELREYELNTVTYGVNCAPYLALRVLQTIAYDDCDGFEGVRHALTHQTYVDDICDGADTIPEVLQLQSDLIFVLNKSGLELKKWASNTPSVLAAVAADDRVGTPMPFEAIEGLGTKVLGIEWHPDGDYFCCALRIAQSPVFTKRGILSLVAQIFDPLGVFGPVVFLAKSIMQRTWQRGLSWDEALPTDIHDDWAAFVSDLPALLSIRIPRHINAGLGASCYLLGFCDASQLGYAAVVYVRMTDGPADTSVFLIGTKTKLAPLKQLTVPRLELNAALLLARWLGRIRCTVAAQLNVIGVRAWSDSTIVLSWLSVSHTSFKIYVSNRVHQIWTLLPDCHWQHVESHNNPADCASRGLMPSALSQLELYWHGPPVAHEDPSVWDDFCPPQPGSDLPEIRPVSCAARVDESVAEWYTRFSNYDRMLRVVAYARRFIAACRHRVSQNLSNTTRGSMPQHTVRVVPAFLCKSEIECAARKLAAASQRVHFAELMRELSGGERVSSKPLARLAPFIDTEGVIRVGGRLRHSLLTYDCKHPILLSKRSYFALLLCRRWHLLTCHAGPRVLSALISRQFWVMSLRSVLHKVIANCTVCVRIDAKPLTPLMADLPSTRVQPRHPFERVGVDYAGPLQMRETRLRKSRIFKIYISVFICFCTKAVHLEVVTDLSTEAFLAAFDRFVARRGVPSDVFSDCGTNFVGADKQLRAIIHKKEGQVAIANSRTMCQWHFNPPSAPHFGGLWEAAAAVRSTKRLLIRTMGMHTFTYEEFSTVLTRVEAILNSRPLTPMSTDPHDLDYLTPGHFLIGRPLLAIPPRSVPESRRNLVNRWKLLDQCHQAFWHRWSTEYLTTLQERAKWTQNAPNIKINDMVVVIDKQSPPLSWRLGRVTELLPGADGNVRVVRVLTHAGVITRPVVKLVLMPTN